MQMFSSKPPQSRRGVGGTTAHPVGSPSQLPTSSLIATHLVPKNGSSVPHFDREDFHLLLEESLGLDEHGQPNLTTDLAINHKLIVVIIQVGLDLVETQQCDPFAQEKSFYDQIIKCLKVIQLAVEKTPGVLALPHRSDDLGHRDEGILLFHRLLPKLLSLLVLDVEKSAQIAQNVWQLLSQIFTSEQRRPKRFAPYFSVSADIEQLIEGLLWRLEQVDAKLPLLKDSSLAFFFHPYDFSAGDWMNARETRGKVDNAVLVGGLLQGLEMAGMLLRLVISSVIDTEALTVNAFSRRLTAVLDHHQWLWNLLMDVSGTSTQDNHKLIDIFAIFIENLQMILLHISQRRRPTMVTQKAYSLWSESLADMVCLLQTNSVVNAEKLVSVLGQTIDISPRAPGLVAAVWQALQPLIGSPVDGRIVLLDASSIVFVRIHVTPWVDLTIAVQEGVVRISDLAAGDARQNLGAVSGPVYDRPGVENESWAEDDRPRKRLRRSSAEPQPETITHAQRLCQQLNHLFQIEDRDELDGLETIAADDFPSMAETDQCRVLQLLGRIACANGNVASYHLTENLASCSTCPLCDDDSDLGTAQHDPTEGPDQLFNILAILLPLLQRSVKVRLSAMSTSRRLLAHTSSATQLDISKSVAGEWCLQSLHSSARELRISATATLKSFMNPSLRVGYEQVHRNRVTALDFLNSLWAKDLPFFQETAIVAMSEAAFVSGEEELNIVLVQFVEFLGHSNPYISGLVYAELQNLARKKKSTPASLLKPFWRTIAVVVIRNFQSQPIISQMVCEFLGTGMSVDVFLMFVEEYTLPYLILTRKIDVVRRIASAHGPTVSLFDLCTNRNNFSAILAYLLAQSGKKGESLVLSLLVNVSLEFRQHDLSEWVKLEPILIACELLKSIGDTGSVADSKAHHGLKQLARLDLRRPTSSNGAQKGEAIGIFLENHVLGIITQFAAIFNESQLGQPNLEKRRCLAAIGELLKLGQHRVTDALPQISACLRSTMESNDLCDKAFDSWALMMLNLPPTTVAPLIDQTLAVIVQNWDVFQDATRKSAYDLVTEIWKNHREPMTQVLDTMPSLSTIPLLSQFESAISESKRKMDFRQQVISFSHRLSSENAALVHQALTELIEALGQNSEWLRQSVLREQPETAVADLTRAILDVCVKFNGNKLVALACGKVLGKIGCLDPNKIETVKERRSVLAISNFGRADETMDFIMFFLEEVLIKAFLAAPNTRSQGLLAWAMQELLKICGLEGAVSLRSRTAANTSKYRGWWDLDESVRNALSPFLNSRYSLNVATVQTQCQYPLFSTQEMSHREWLQTLVLDLLTRAPGENIQLIFTICLRIIRSQDLSIPVFLLPYAALNLFVAAPETQGEDKQNLLSEMITVLKQPLSGTHEYNENIKLCSQRVFDVLDYMSKWLQQRRKQFQATVARAERGTVDDAVQLAQLQISTVESVLEGIPPDLISCRAIECGSYSRALFHWEQYIRQIRAKEADSDKLLARLQEIYTQIDEPDGIEGISAQMHALNIDQQVLEHQKAANWTAAQTWWEIQLQENAEDGAVQTSLLTCLRETGQNDALLNQFDAFEKARTFTRVVPFAVEAAWASSNWKKLNKIVNSATGTVSEFNVGVGTVLQALQTRDYDRANSLIADLRLSSATSLTSNSISSFQSCHEVLFRLHALADLEDISSAAEQSASKIHFSLSQRTELLGADVSAKQYLLGLQRAAMTLSPSFNELDVAFGWLATAKLARKSSLSSQAFNAILHATALGENSATIEHAKLMWKDGLHRKAIRKLEGAIRSGAFASHNFESNEITLTTDQINQQNVVVAKAQLMLGKWLDSAGQTQSDVIKKQYRTATDSHNRWDKGWYYLGKHYNKILDSERAKPMGKEAQSYLTGEASKLVIENYLRALAFGGKYVFQTLPKVLTLWLELVAGTDQPQDARRGNDKFNAHLSAQRKKVVEETNIQVQKYVNRLQPVMWYTILSQVIARIDLPHQLVSDILVGIVVKVLRAFPRQAIWPVLALAKSSSKGRAKRGLTILSKAVETQKKSSKDTPAKEMRELIIEGQQLSSELLRIADHELKDSKATRVSLLREFKFNHKIAPCRLVVPIETCLIPSMPNVQDPWPAKSFQAFPSEPVTIAAFLDDALVLASLQKPRKLTIRGSDGTLYAVLAKPKDDLRKDQRLMEFNTMINRFLKRDVEASKRRLYIRTYAVVPLNEECGVIEWVNNLRTLRDILIRLYKERGIGPNYAQIRALLDEACTLPKDQTAERFESKILTLFPAIFHEWFVESFPDSSTWVAARLRYTRSCAVMSVVGHVLGLGDRHGENILFEEDNGGTLHVDFNCLFDKGLTFEKPELVPFRLTHNMVDAFGVYGYDGPFRRCCEITLILLRGNEDALMTILETFLYDPTTDFMGGKKKRTHPKVADTPQGVLEGIRSKTRGILDGESIPLSVAGYVEEMIKRATDSDRLARMYIGWCAFF